MMENSILLNEIQKSFNFLIKKYSFNLEKAELHWLGGALVEYMRDNTIISLLYDKRESWFYCKLFTIDNKNKAPLFFHTELNKFCEIVPNPVISIDNDKEIFSYLKTISTCLEKNLNNVIDKFELNDYWKQ